MPLPRSPELMNADDTVLLLVDMQERLMPAIADGERVAWNARRLLDGAKALGVMAVATEQVPDKLGPTLPELAERLGPCPAKRMFSCRECDAMLQDWLDRGVHRVLIAGVETHVCVQQTALDLLAAGLHIYLATDAVGSRYPVDHQTALRRMESSGATLTTTEAALFEWCVEAGTPGFKAVSALAKETL